MQAFPKLQQNMVSLHVVVIKRYWRKTVNNLSYIKVEYIYDNEKSRMSSPVLNVKSNKISVLLMNRPTHFLSHTLCLSHSLTHGLWLSHRLIYALYLYLSFTPRALSISLINALFPSLMGERVCKREYVWVRESERDREWEKEREGQDLKGGKITRTRGYFL